MKITATESHTNYSRKIFDSTRAFLLVPSAPPFLLLALERTTLKRMPGIAENVGSIKDLLAKCTCRFRVADCISNS